MTRKFETHVTGLGFPEGPVALPDGYFGEGLAAVGSELVQLTWKAGRALVYDADSLTVRCARLERQFVRLVVSVMGLLLC